ncbi:6-carboxytetrahydropterin synthase [Oceaniserpentilla sp. 4NH20-0058]|uniref:6-carboxytetrahydropterin synthase n=1 Tax=Oceaniserpentilla sp. 4NH20-0058 TaxID=3127660 RepID=UPI0031091938
MKLFVENLNNVDVSYLDAKRGLVGESWMAGITLTGTLDNQSMICDFGVVKKTAKNWLDEFIDHRLVVPANMADLHISKHASLTTVKFPHPCGGEFICSAPDEAFCFIDCETIDSDSVSKWLNQRLNSVIPGDIDDLSVTLTTETIDGAFYHYSHGLKKHNGNCQRIAHGHRSKIEIYIDNSRNTQLEHDWAVQWNDIYIGTIEDLHNQPEIQGVIHNHYRYTAPQGEFSLTLPQSACYDIETDSTVEQIANHIAGVISKSHNNVLVKAFEGIGKGAIASYE